MPYRVILTVKESRGNCPYHKVGDQITFEDPEIVKAEGGNLCLYASYPWLRTSQHFAETRQSTSG